MSILNNLKDIQIPITYLNKLLNIYTSIGKLDYYQLEMNDNLEELEKETLNKNVLAISKLLDLHITDDRKRLMLYKNSEPKSKSEECFLNIKKILNNINKENIDNTNLNLNSADLLNHLNKLSTRKINLKTNDFSLRGERKSIRYFMNETLDLMANLFDTKKDNVEKILITTAAWIELSIIAGYSEYNEVACFILIYYYLLKMKFNYVKYFPFFEYLIDDLNNIKDIIRRSTVNYEKENIYVLNLYDYLLTLCERLCEKMNDELLSFEDVKRLNKSDIIENAIINQMPNIFTKKDLIKLFPNISSITIERKLEEFKNKNYISPLGTGRNAQWMKLEPLLDRNKSIAELYNLNNNIEEDDN